LIELIISKVSNAIVKDGVHEYIDQPS